MGQERKDVKNPAFRSLLDDDLPHASLPPKRVTSRAARGDVSCGVINARLQREQRRGVVGRDGDEGDEVEVRHHLHNLGVQPVEAPHELERAWREARPHAADAAAAAASAVVAVVASVIAAAAVGVGSVCSASAALLLRRKERLVERRKHAAEVQHVRVRLEAKACAEEMEVGRQRACMRRRGMLRCVALATRRGGQARRMRSVVRMQASECFLVVNQCLVTTPVRRTMDVVKYRH